MAREGEQEEEEEKVEVEVDLESQPILTTNGTSRPSTNTNTGSSTRISNGSSILKSDGNYVTNTTMETVACSDDENTSSRYRHDGSDNVVVDGNGNGNGANERNGSRRMLHHKRKTPELLPDITPEMEAEYKKEQEVIQKNRAAGRSEDGEPSNICGIPYHLFLALVVLGVAVVIGTVLAVIYYDPNDYDVDGPILTPEDGGAEGTIEPSEVVGDDFIDPSLSMGSSGNFTDIPSP